MKDTVAVLLAAGRGTRIKSKTPKVLHEVLGKPIIGYVFEALDDAGISDIVTVAGFGSELLKKRFPEADVVLQKELLGSGDAVRTAKKALLKYPGDILVICGDTPLVRSESIRALVARHKTGGASATLLTAKVKDPTNYGRIVRDDKGKVTRIVEELEAPLYEKVIDEINVGTYCFKAADLFMALEEIRADNAKKEFYITDVISILHREGKTIESVGLNDPEEMIGINTRKDLSEATRIMKNRILDGLMLSGVTIQDPSSTTVYPGTKIGQDTIIYPNTFIEEDVEIGKDCRIGPFARIHPKVRIGRNVEIGNFVELNRTRIGDGTKVKHHAYLGDTTVGSGVNIGAGTITANYDGKNKNPTVIEDNAFIGVGAILIAPVKVGKGAVVGAGCVVPKRHNVPKGATVVGVPARVIKGKTKREK